MLHVQIVRKDANIRQAPVQQRWQFCPLKKLWITYMLVSVYILPLIPFLEVFLVFARHEAYKNARLNGIYVRYGKSADLNNISLANQNRFDFLSRDFALLYMHCLIPYHLPMTELIFKKTINMNAIESKPFPCVLVTF